MNRFKHHQRVFKEIFGASLAQLWAASYFVPFYLDRSQSLFLDEIVFFMMSVSST
jgi:hypothetical protein